jgi:hypothetical protein
MTNSQGQGAWGVGGVRLVAKVHLSVRLRQPLRSVLVLERQPHRLERRPSSALQQSDRLNIVPVPLKLPQDLESRKSAGIGRVGANPSAGER